MGNIIKSLSFIVILSLIYAYGISRWLYTLSICAVLGEKRANSKRASLAYFLLKSCANALLFASFAWLIASAETLDQKRIDAITVFSNNAAAFLDAQSHSVAMVLLAIAAVGFICVKLCQSNGRLAMREIYITDATSEQVMEIKIIVLVTLLALSTFSLRLTEPHH
jgi:hypothetical protein